MEDSLNLIFGQSFITIIFALSTMIMAVTAKINDLLKATSKAVKVLISLFVSGLITGLLKLLGALKTWAILSQVIDDPAKAPIMPASAPNSYYFIVGLVSFVMANGLYDLIKNFTKKQSNI